MYDSLAKLSYHFATRAKSPFAATEKQPDLWVYTCPVTRVIAYKQIQATISSEFSQNRIRMGNKDSQMVCIFFFDYFIWRLYIEFTSYNLISLRDPVLFFFVCFIL